ncbi:mitochondrial inheritance component mdm12 [Coprinopsis cinerea okayama7|uniref:Mitochondrial distribution and morphology protein 12 n=1 Tax=Coprinopsis cinerea (strain Okayama-7 / 130 / ATCC MYA-4618 / FGSC 9003) TaxID=240176 RepID=MDM12_COPC7|nr:mitochondrial inheritance component mdm12 [Coprinopsis cinerea okayama7\|eukprot:XP_001833012.2 mitochondrial inheritance component mdm12 [Coprinopsis cinerea okayama7\
MSIDLEWAKLDSSLANYLVDVLNRQLSNAQRPSFIGPVEVTSLEFGSASPDVELVDLRDIYRDFLEDDEDDSSTSPVKVTEGQLDAHGGEDDDGYEWVPRRAAAREYYTEGGGHGGNGSHLPMHLRHPPLRSSPTDTFSSLGHSMGMTMPVGLDMWTGHGALFHHQGSGGSPALAHGGPILRSPSPSTPFPVVHTPPLGRTPTAAYRSSSALDPDSSFLNQPVFPSQQPQQQQPQQENNHPNLQLHLQVNWHSNLRITITTSLLINYPSPMFMSLPIKLSVTGLVFNGELAVAYEGQRRRVHVCILDDLDPYGPAGDRPKREVDPDTLNDTAITPPDLDEDSPPNSGRPQKPLPIGQRLLPSIFIESEIGQADKHVLKNVTRVERFIQDVIRKTVEEELVFPNFHTLVMGDG